MAIEALWVKSLLGELSIQLPKIPSIHYDNISAIYLFINPIFHSKMNHITINFHFVCNHVANGNLTDRTKICINKMMVP